MPKISKYNGGYVIISLNDEDIYEKIERNLYKPILLTDIVINGIEKNDVFTTAYVEGTNIVFKDIYDKDITISDNNSVSIGDNGKHLYRYMFNYSDTCFAYLSNKSFSRLNERISLITTLGEIGITSEECKEIINAFDNISKHCPMEVTSDSTISLNVNINSGILQLATTDNYIDIIINVNGTVTETTHNEDIDLYVEKIF